MDRTVDQLEQALKQLIGENAIRGEDPHAAAVQLHNDLLAISQDLGSKYDDDVDPPRKAWLEEFSKALSDYVDDLVLERRQDRRVCPRGRRQRLRSQQRRNVISGLHPGEEQERQTRRLGRSFCSPAVCRRKGPPKEFRRSQACKDR